jgi:nucleotide-binding universal stress UspA family protein
MSSDRGVGSLTVAGTEIDTTHTIVAGIDGSDASVAAARWAAQQASLTGSRLEVVSAWQGPGSWGISWASAIPIPTDYDPVGDTQSMVDEVIGSLGPDFPTVTIDGRVAEGHPAEVLVEASRHADLLVVGSRGHGEFTGMLIGSVSQHCAANAKCSVVIVREPDNHPA